MNEISFKRFKAWTPKISPNQILSDIDDILPSSNKNLLSCPNKIKDNACQSVFFNAMCNKEIFVENTSSSYYIYELQNAHGIKRGITVAIDINLYEKKIIRCENVMEDVVREKITSFNTLQLQLNPITLACSKNEPLFTLIESISKKFKPIISINHEDTLNTVWSINNQLLIKAIDNILHKIDFFYIVDGHHRAESIFRMSTKTKTNCYLTACIFPLESIETYPYHRIISFKESNEHLSKLVVSALKNNFKLTASHENFNLPTNNQIGLSLFGTWYRLEYNPKLSSEEVEANFLHNHILPIIKKVLGEYQIQYVSNEHFSIKSNTRLSTDKDIIFILPPPETKKLFSSINQKKNKSAPKLAQCTPKLLSGLIIYNQQEHIWQPLLNSRKI